MTERIRISGRLNAEGGLTLRPAFPTAIPPERWRRDALVYVVEVLDAQGHALARVPLSASGTCGSDSTALRGSVDLPDGAARLDVLHVDASGRDPIVLASEPVPERPPELRLIAVPEGEVEGEFTLTWEASGDPSPVRYFVDYSPGRETWEPLSLGVSEPRLAVDFDSLAGGDACRVAVTASNGLRASRVESGPFRVRVKPCAAVILRPVDGEELPSNVVFVGNGWWREEGRPEFEALTWASDVQGELGRGRQVTARLEPGTHHITLHTGTEDRAGEESVTVHVT
ncbi:MAG: hypothetical protein ACR2H9_18585 [Longimicrobiaceae bacterium]